MLLGTKENAMTAVKAISTLFFLIVFAISTVDIIVNESNIQIEYPYMPFNKNVFFKWGGINKVEVVYRGGCTHGAMMPSYMIFHFKNGKQKKENYRLSREELNLLKSLIESKGVKFICKNNPYQEWPKPKSEEGDKIDN